jgi:hypothetical protein
LPFKINEEEIQNKQTNKKQNKPFWHQLNARLCVSQRFVVFLFLQIAHRTIAVNGSLFGHSDQSSIVRLDRSRKVLFLVERIPLQLQLRARSLHHVRRKSWNGLFFFFFALTNILISFSLASYLGHREHILVAKHPPQAFLLTIEKKKKKWETKRETGKCNHSNLLVVETHQRREREDTDPLWTISLFLERQLQSYFFFFPFSLDEQWLFWSVLVA